MYSIHKMQLLHGIVSWPVLVAFFLDPSFRTYVLPGTLNHVFNQGRVCLSEDCCLCNICLRSFEIEGCVGRSSTRGSRLTWLQYGRGLYFSSSSGKANDFAASTKKVCVPFASSLTAVNTARALCWRCICLRQTLTTELAVSADCTRLCY